MFGQPGQPHRPADPEAADAGVRPAKVFDAVWFTLLGTVGLLAWAAIFIFVRQTAAGLTALLLFIVLLISCAIARSGRGFLASVIIISSLWAVVTVSIYLAGGVNTVLTCGYFALTIAAGMLLGRRAALLVACAGVAACFGFALFESYGGNPPRYFPVPPLSASFMILLWFCVALPPLWITLKDLNETLAAARNELRQRRKSEEALRESEERYRELFDNSADLIYTHDMEGNYTSVNKAVERILGYTAEEFLRLNFRDIVDPEHLEPTEEQFRTKAEGRADRTGPYEVLVKKKDGDRVWLEVNSRIIIHEGRRVGVHGTARDVTDRRIAQNQLKKLSAAVEQAGETIIITDPRGIIEYVNPSFEATTGYSRAEVLGKPPSILKSGMNDRSFYREMWDTVRAGRVWRGRFTNRRKDGSLYEETATIAPVKDEKGRIVNYVGVERDVTEEVMLQKQLAQAQKMEAIGTLAGGMAHDLNNVLQAILGYSELLLMKGDLQDADRKKLGVIREAARGGADLVERILTFGRKSEHKKRPIHLNEEIRKAVRLLGRTLPRMIAIEPVLADDLHVIDADPGQIEQIVLNLAVNARDAMPDGGRLVIETRNISLSDEYLRAHLDARPGKYVLLTISDTGVGMEPDVLERIFEPFFTTKSDAGGTGLGLAMVHGIVAQHGGYVKCYSEPGRGTSFKIYFPVSPGSVGADPELTREMPAFGTETILLVDDDDQIREMAREMIELGGYRVISARSGEEALEAYKSREAEISLVILDLIMPGMGGHRCLEELMRIDPDIYVLLASGYSENGLSDLGKGTGARGFIRKPYGAKDILRAIRTILDNGSL